MQDNAVKILLPIGTLCDGTCVSPDLKRLPHLLIAGGRDTRRYLTRLVISAASAHSPDALRVLAMHFDGALDTLPHLLSAGIEAECDSEAALLWLTDEMDRRYGLLTEAKARTVDDYNARSASKLYYIIAAVGALEKLSKRAKERAALIAAKARAAGIYLVACTENADKKVITDIIKINIPSHIALKTETKAQSRLIIGVNGAETLEENELLFLPVGSYVPQKLVYTAPSDSELRTALSELNAAYPRAELVSITARKEKEPPLLLSALVFLQRNGGATAALLQRGLKISYRKAAGLIEEMENAGYIGEFNGSKPRAILLTDAELEKLISELRRDMEI